MAQKLYPASNPRDDTLFNQLFYHQYLLDHPNPVVTFTTPSTPDTDFSVDHELGRVPSGYLLIKSDAPVIIYSGQDTWTDTEMSLCATESGVTCSVVIL